MNQRRLRSTIGLLLVIGVVTGCAGGSDVAPTPPPPAPAIEAPATTPATGGWVDGPPDWTGPGESAESASVSETTAATGRAVDAASGDEGHLADTSGPRSGPLRAGSVDDNEDFEGYLAYLDRIDSLGIALRELDPRGRIVVEVTGTSGLPVPGAEVVFNADGAEVARVRTTADGSVRFHPPLYGAGDVATFDISVEDTVVTAAPGDTVAIESPTPGGAVAPVPLDVLFLLDATGSMGDEIDRLKQSIDLVADRLAALEAAPDLRFAMTLYRDEGDDFVTATHDFTSDVVAFRQALSEVVADGGGDYPEALDEGLAEALAVPSWRDAANTVQLVFLIADAPPQVGRQVETPYPASVVEAVARGVKIFPVASSESDDQAEAVFRQIAQATGARFVFLSYGAAGAATGGNTDIGPTDYEELALEDLIVRLVAEELAALSGDPGQVPPTSSTSTTVPDGQ